MSIKFSSIQGLGRALMLPIAMLPVAGLLLRFGQPDLLNIAAVADAGNAVFANLPLLFAIGVAVGFARDNNGAAGLAGAVGYLILVAMLKDINKDIDTGVLGGILIGSIAGVTYNRYKGIRLPEFLAFFGGKRFVPIATGIFAVILGTILGVVWPPIQHGLHIFSSWMSESGELGLFFFGMFNRILLVTGLHHVLNSLFWFQLGDFTNTQGVVVHGDIARFMAGDKTAGYFMAGWFPIMMFGLPAICLAMYTTAFKENKKAVAGLLLSMALTSFLTGVTEPIEYSFVFIAPVLYVIHALLSGISMAVSYWLNIHLGFSFSAGAIDYVLFYKLAQNPLYMLPIGAVTFIVYYLLAVFFIKKFNLPTIGRDIIEEPGAEGLSQAAAHSLEAQYIEALGGARNLINVDACTTRLRLVVKDNKIINKDLLKRLGAKGFVAPSPDSFQVVIGPQADIIASDIRELLSLSDQKHFDKTDNSEVARNLSTGITSAPELGPINEIVESLGGVSNLISVHQVAITRVKIELKDGDLINLERLKFLGILEVITTEPNIKQLYMGSNSSIVVKEINQIIQYK